MSGGPTWRPPRPTAAVLALAVVSLAAVACDSGPCGRRTPQAELTQGAAPTVPLEDGDGIVMVHGPQGGWHLSLGVMVTDPDPFVIVDIDVEGAGEVVVANHYEFVLDEHDGCTGTREDLYGFLDVTSLRVAEQDTPPEILGGETLYATLRVTSSEGESEDAVELRAELDPKDE